jgi:hypothetical protein
MLTLEDRAASVERRVVLRAVRQLIVEQHRTGLLGPHAQACPTVPYKPLLPAAGLDPDAVQVDFATRLNKAGDPVTCGPEQSSEPNHKIALAWSGRKGFERSYSPLR